jgi:hypothetical protein
MLYSDLRDLLESIFLIRFSTIIHFSKVVCFQVTLACSYTMFMHFWHVSSEYQYTVQACSKLNLNRKRSQLTYDFDHKFIATLSGSELLIKLF